MRAEPTAFRVDGPLPGPGLTVIEASAGTGKTYTLTSLIVRFVADGVPLSAILAVTFTRMATGELRDRIRVRLAQVYDALDRRFAGVGSGAEDTLVELLAAGAPEDIADRLVNLAVALADFDAATIATTHGFCQMVLHGLGSAGDTSAETELLEDPQDLVAEVVDDLYLRWSTKRGPISYEPLEARRAALAAVAHGDAPIFRYPEGGRAAGLAEIATAARAEVARRLLLQDSLTYDELLGRLARTLESPTRGPEARRRLAARYQVVLVDEFQDTDPVQWSILRHAFSQDPPLTRLILIGDPKQAIYAFRGADVHSYLEAAEAADVTWTLEENHRTDQPLIDAIEAFFQPTRFGHDGIPFRTVRAAPTRQSSPFKGAPFRMRVVDDNHAEIAKTGAKKLLRKQALVEWVARDVATDIDRFLRSRPSIPDGTGGARLLEARDIAVLTHTNDQALKVRDALRGRGVPSVVGGVDSVFRSDAATAWVRLLEALQEPTSRSRLVAVALTPFVGMTVEQVSSASEAGWEDLYERVLGWAGVLAGRGVAALHRAITDGEGLPGRVLSVEGGERLLTDLGHVAQLLHAEATAGQLGAASLRTWLATRIRSVAEEQAGIEERSRRLDSDAAAVQVLTVHRAKGLEFAVVYCPYLWDGGWTERGGRPVVFHDPDAGRRTLDAGCPDQNDFIDRQTYETHARWHELEELGEDLRLMYVAVTRARHRVVLWWGRAQRSGASPLGRLLLCREPETGVVGPARDAEPQLFKIRPALDQIRGRAGQGLFAIETAGGSRATLELVPDAPDGAEEPPLELAVFDRILDQRWRRASYSSITAAHTNVRAAVASEPEDSGLSDEPVAGGDMPSGAPGDGPAPVDSVLSPWGSIIGGAEVGTFVHRVLESTDFAAADPATEVHRAVQEALRSGGPPIDPAVLSAALTATISTPLGPGCGGDSLRAIARSDRLDEMGFELPVPGGARPTGSVSTASIAELLDAHLEPGGLLAGYADRLRDPTLDADLRGYLAGSLDLVFRRPRPGGRTQWVVADYKTNWLGPPGQVLTAGHYSRSAMDREMRHHHYPLQAILYMVALHRFLRWRQPGYRPESDLGGVYYLFVRGMVGLDAPIDGDAPCGVFHWAVPPALVLALSELFDRSGGAG
jgi:exodeoxyribonuclease V beta subunit